MRHDDEGFLIPIVDDTLCVDCGLCEKRCPVINIPMIAEVPQKVYAAYNLNKEQHQRSASGGLFSVFANYFYDIANGVVCASAFDSQLHLRFCISTNKCDLRKLRGSKYVQSEVGMIFKEIKELLVDKKEVFFLGTPCQVAGLRSYLGRDYQNLFAVDLVCHGVPSPELFQSYLDSLGIKLKQGYDNFYFRSQEESVYFTGSFEQVDGKQVQIPTNKHSYISAYLKGWIHRESCYNCPFVGKHRQGDITISDFWGILYGLVPFGRSIKHGVSMVILNTYKGQSLFERIKGQLYFEEKTFDEALIENHNLVRPDIRPGERDYMYHELSILTPEEFMKKYNCQLNLPIPLWKRVLRLFHV